MQAARADFLLQMRRAGHPLVVFDIPLLFETSLEGECDEVLAAGIAVSHGSSVRVCVGMGMGMGMDMGMDMDTDTDMQPHMKIQTRARTRV